VEEVDQDRTKTRSESPTGRWAAIGVNEVSQGAEAKDQVSNHYSER
jgi:hypothetical protein